MTPDQPIKHIHAAHWLLHAAQAMLTLMIAVFVESTITTGVVLKKQAPVSVRWQDGSITTNYAGARLNVTNLVGQIPIETGCADDGSICWRFKK